MQRNSRRSDRILRSRVGHRTALEFLERRDLMAASVLITELVADNVDGLRDNDGDRSDWIELFNASDAAVPLGGWRLTDDSADTGLWTFPNVTLDSGERLIVFASGKDRRDPGAELHTNFRLSADGEYLGLVEPNGQIAQQFSPAFPAQSPRASFGFSQSAQATVLLTQGSAARTFVPTAENGGDALGTAWTGVGFNDAAWAEGTLGMGFERQSGYEGLIGADVGDDMYGVNSSAYVRVHFDSTGPAAVSKLTLRMKYDDGFAAYLNGQLIATRNTPDPLWWNSSAAAQHPDIENQSFEDIDVTAFKAALVDGDNVLAIHGLNTSPANGDFVILPELVSELLAPLGDAPPRYFLTPTPGAANVGESFEGVAADPVFSAERGFYFAAQTVVLTSSTPGVEIRYTTDGTAPTAARGIVYTGPINVSTTATLRAATFKSGYADSLVETHTLIFPESVIRQPALPAGLPSSWAGTPADYQMDPDVVNSAAYRDQIVAGLQSIPTMSIVTAQDNLFGQTNGIYVNSTMEGDAWERPISVELILPDGSTGFQENAGLRIWGTGWRPHSASLKHAFQLKFKPTYGASKLDYPLFPDASANEFDDIVLRAQGSKSWNDFRQPDIYQTQYIQDAWARDTAQAMGKVEGHATFVHLYLNGLYWGLYNPVERTNESFGEEYFGGEDDEYDVVSRRAGIPNEATAGDLTAWNQMMAIVNAGLSTPQQYSAIQQLVDIDDLIDYMLIQQYATNHDGPDNDGNNMRAMRRRDADGKWRFFVWDMEYTFWYPGELRNVNVDVADTVTHIYAKLRQNSEFRLRYADRVQKHFFNDGALTSENAAARWQARADEIYGGVIAESARWGDVRRGTPFTRDVEWAAELDRLMTEYFPVRTQVLLGQLRDAGLYPSLDPPEFNQHGGEVGAGFELDIDTARGYVFYTTDGSDPRLPGGAASPTAKVFTPETQLVGPTSAARVFVPEDDSLGMRWNGSEPRFSDADWLGGTAEVGFDTTTPPASTSVQLTNATADFSQSGYSVANVIDGNPSGAGWALSQPVDYQGPVSIAATAVFETADNVGFEAGTQLTFTLRHDAIDQHNLGRFRIAITTDDRSTFANGQANHGDVTANWITLAPESFSSSGGATMTLKHDGSMLVTGGTNRRDTYTITAITPLQNITGVRLEAINDAALPFRGGPGRSDTGNAVLTELTVRAAPAKLDHLADPALGGTLSGEMISHNASAYARIPFTLDGIPKFDRLSLNMQYADGFVAYLNGHEIARRSAPEQLEFNSTALSARAGGLAMVSESLDVSAAQEFFRDGQNILAVHVLNDGIADGTLLARPQLIGERDPHELLVQSGVVKARALADGVWSALTEAEFVAPVPLRVTELMYHPRDAAAGEPYDDNDFEYVELANVSGGTISLDGVQFTRGIAFAFSDGDVTSLGPGERVLLVKNKDAFAARYGSGYRIAGVFTGQLDNSGERLTLVDANDRVILDFTYDDAWLPSTDGEGAAMVIVDPLGAAESWGTPNAWQVSAQLDGSPGLPESSGLTGDTDADGDVDLDDLNNVRNQFGGRGLGDADRDRDIDLDDLNAVRNNFGATGAALQATSSQLPEVATATGRKKSADAADAVFAQWMAAGANDSLRFATAHAARRSREAYLTGKRRA